MVLEYVQRYFMFLSSDRKPNSPSFELGWTFWFSYNSNKKNKTELTVCDFGDQVTKGTVASSLISLCHSI